MKKDDPLREGLLERQCCRTLVGAAAVLLAMLAGCYYPHPSVSPGVPLNLGWLKDEPLDRGNSHAFAADYEAVVGAAREAVQEVGFELLARDYPVNDSTWVIVCEKYAQYLRVVVQRLGEKQTAVRVIFRRGEGVEVWRMEDYSQDIFAALIEKLEGKPQRPEPSPSALLAQGRCHVGPRRRKWDRVCSLAQRP